MPDLISATTPDDIVQKKKYIEYAYLRIELLAV